MMTRSQTRIAQLEEEKDFYKDLHEGFAYKLFLKEKELQARIVELEKENDMLSGKYSDLWHYGCNDDLGEADIVEMLLAKGEKKRVMDVWSDVYEENRDHFEFNEDSEDDDSEDDDSEDDDSEELQIDFWDNMGEMWGYDIIGSESHPLKKAFKLYCEMKKEREDE